MRNFVTKRCVCFFLLPFLSISLCVCVFVWVHRPPCAAAVCGEENVKWACYWLHGIILSSILPCTMNGESRRQPFRLWLGIIIIYVPIVLLLYLSRNPSLDPTRCRALPVWREFKRQPTTRKTENSIAPVKMPDNIVCASSVRRLPPPAVSLAAAFFCAFLPCGKNWFLILSL